MKKIEAIIRPWRLYEVEEELQSAGVEAISAVEIKGFGRQKGRFENYRGSEYGGVEHLPAIMIMLIVSDDEADAVVDAILRSARTGKSGGDGNVIVSTVDDFIQIRTGARGKMAL